MLPTLQAPIVEGHVLTSTAPDEHPEAVIFDIDGTLALHDGREPFDWHLVLRDRPNFPVIGLLRMVAAAGIKIVLASGRMELCRPDTEKWLSLHVRAPYDMLIMRPDEKQYVPDNEIKAEMFETVISKQFSILFVVDDRKRVVDMWRSKGLTVLQCAEGDF